MIRRNLRDRGQSRPITSPRHAGPGRGDQRHEKTPSFVIGGQSTRSGVPDLVGDSRQRTHQSVQHAVRATITLNGWRGQQGRGDLIGHIGQALYVENGRIVGGDSYDGTAGFIMSDIESFMTKHSLKVRELDQNNTVEVDCTYVVTETTSGRGFGRSIVLFDASGKAIAQSDALAAEIGDNADLIEEIEMLKNVSESTTRGAKPRERATFVDRPVAQITQPARPARPDGPSTPARPPVVEEDNSVFLRVQTHWNGFRPSDEKTGRLRDFMATIFDQASYVDEHGQVVTDRSYVGMTIFMIVAMMTRAVETFGIKFEEHSQNGYPLELIVRAKEWAENENQRRGYGQAVLVLNNGQVIAENVGIVERFTDAQVEEVRKLLTATPPTKATQPAAPARPATPSAPADPPKPAMRSFVGTAAGFPAIGRAATVTAPSQMVPVTRKPDPTVMAATEEAFAPPPRAVASSAPSGSNGTSDGSAEESAAPAASSAP